MSEIHLHGYFGMNNLGDDLMLNALLANISRNKKVICWMSKNTSQHELIFWKRTFPTIIFKRYPRSFLLFPFLITWKKIEKSIWVGGNCFYTHEKNTNLKWLLKLVKCYHKLKTPFIFLGVGIGNCDLFGKKIIREILSISHKLYFRDNSYLKFMDECEHKVFKCGDLASLFPLKNIKADNEKKGYIISGHKFFSKNKDAINAIQKAIDQLDDDCYVIDFHQGWSGDHSFNQKLSNVKYIQNQNLEEIINLMKSVKGLISFRLHSILLSDLLNLPNIAINYDPKIAAYFSRMGRSSDTLISVGEHFNPNQVLEKWTFDERKIESEKFDSMIAIKEIFHSKK